MPAGWAYDTVLEGIADQLHHSHPELAEELRANTTQVSQAYLDLSSLDFQSFNAIRRGAKEYLKIVGEAGPSSFADSQFFDGFIRKLQELIVMLDRDPRVSPD